MKVQIKVEYPLKDLTKDQIALMDDKIEEAMKYIGAKWYAQGHDCFGQNPMRDLAFDLEIE